jgi:hypothetical protein
MSDDTEKTVRMVINLDRTAIEKKLAEVRKAAQDSNLPELASMFVGVEGMPQAQIAQRVGNALKWVAGKSEHRAIAAQLELVELNLPNLK